MAKSIFGKDLKEKIQTTVDNVKSAAGEIDVSEIKSAVAGSIDAAKSAVKDIEVPDVQEIKSTIAEKMEGTIEVTKEHIDKAVESIKEKTVTVEKVDADENEAKPFRVVSLSSRDALKIIYFVMACDRVIDQEEEEKFNEIGNALDPGFADNKESIIGECKAQIENKIDEGDYFDVIRDGIEDALIASMQVINTPITPKLLLWDLLTIAYSDNRYDETERKLIKYIVRKCEIDKAMFLEMESSLLTLIDIEKEINWIKTTDRPYLQIEAVVNELADRKNVIFDSVRDLISL